MAVAPGGRCPAPLAFLLLVVVVLACPAVGNEGGAAGSCRCRKVNAPPKFLGNLDFCDTCADFTRFNFPNRRLCVLNEEGWLLELKNSVCGKGRPGEAAGRADASRGHSLPVPTSQTTASPPASPSSAAVSRDKSQEMPWVAESHPGVAQVPGMARSTPEPSAAEPAARGAIEAPLEEEEEKDPAPDVKIFLLIIIPLVVVAGFVVFVVCRSRRGERRASPAGQGPRTPLGEEERTFCLPGENT